MSQRIYILKMLVFAGLVAVCASGAWANALWWDKLGSEAEVLQPMIGTPPAIEGQVRFVPGVFGQGYAAVGPSFTGDRIILPSGGLSLNPEAGTIEAWVMYPRSPIVLAYGYGMFSMVDGPYQVGYDPSLGGQVMNYIGDGATGTLNTFYCDVNFGSLVRVEIPNIDQVFHPGEWHLLTLAWDRAGLGGTADRVRVYVDGVVRGATANSNWGSTPDNNRRHTIGKGVVEDGLPDPAFVIDNIKIWDYAELYFPPERFTQEGWFRLDCNENTIPDECDLSCGTPGGPCNMPGCGQSQDCNHNGIPDECELDTDQDGVIDACDNCPPVPNGPTLGTCIPGQDRTCHANADCDSAPSVGDGLCSMNQEITDTNINTNPNQLGDACNPDIDGDGVPNELDVCPMNKPGLSVCSDGRPRLDLNGDCNVDGLDMQLIVQELLK